MYCIKRNGKVRICRWIKQDQLLNQLNRLRRKRTHHGIRDNYRKQRTRAYTRDLDQIADDLKPENIDKKKHQEIDTDLPGLGQHYCVECA